MTEAMQRLKNVWKGIKKQTFISSRFDPYLDPVRGTGMNPAFRHPAPA